MHRLSSSFVLAYHGCQADVAEKLLAGDIFQPSENDYDWLGSGIYFWEANPKRALEWAMELQTRKSIVKGQPSVVGAAIDLGYCLDLISSSGIEAVKTYYELFVTATLSAGKTLPINRGKDDDLLQRHLDCAVINYMHSERGESVPALQPFDTVRGVFLEGKPIYTGAGFREKTHIQICVRNPSVIKGVFRVSEKDLR